MLYAVRILTHTRVFSVSVSLSLSLSLSFSLSLSLSLSFSLSYGEAVVLAVKGANLMRGLRPFHSALLQPKQGLLDALLLETCNLSVQYEDDNNKIYFAEIPATANEPEAKIMMRSTPYVEEMR
jgi:hypothetical protein